MFNDDKEKASKHCRSEGRPGTNPTGLFLFTQGYMDFFSSALKCQDLSDKV